MVSEVKRVGLLWLAVALTFLATGPWSVGSVVIERFEVILGVGVLLLAGASVYPGRTRDDLRRLMTSEIALSTRQIVVFTIVAALFLVRITLSKYHGLDVSAWDFSLYFDRPIERTLHGELLYCAYLDMPTLGNHAGWLLLAIVPLYALVATPYWLVLLQGVAIAVALPVAFLFFRRSGGDDVVAGMLTLALLFNTYTAKAVQYVFHVEIFYPLALFLILYGFVSRRSIVFLAGLLLAVSIKEDAIVPIAGFALTAAVMFRKWRWGGAALAIGLSVFAIDYFVVMPHFAGEGSTTPWYAGYWGSLASSPLEVPVGIVTSPLVPIGRVAAAAVALFSTLAFLPLLGFEWLLAMAVPLVVYGSADFEKLRTFSLYYSMPVLPLIFASLPAAIERGRRRLNLDPRLAGRVLALIVLLASAFVGSGYKLAEPREDRKVIPRLVERIPGSRNLVVQGTLMPHAAYGTNLVPLEHASLDGEAFLLCEDCGAWPLSDEELTDLIDRLRRDGDCVETHSKALSLFDCEP